jgi:hypothetical protein
MVEEPDLPALKCSSHWSLGFYLASVEHGVLVVNLPLVARNGQSPSRTQSRPPAVPFEPCYI